MEELKTPPDACLPSGTRDFCYGGMYVDGKELPWLDRVHHYGGKNWGRVQETDMVSGRRPVFPDGIMPSLDPNRA
jgi:hypothetical protein